MKMDSDAVRRHIVMTSCSDTGGSLQVMVDSAPRVGGMFSLSVDVRRTKSPSIVRDVRQTARFTCMRGVAGPCDPRNAKRSCLRHSYVGMYGQASEGHGAQWCDVVQLTC